MGRIKKVIINPAKRLAIFAAVRYNISVNRKFVRGVFAPQIGDTYEIKASVEAGSGADC